MGGDEDDEDHYQRAFQKALDEGQAVRLNFACPLSLTGPSVSVPVGTCLCCRLCLLAPARPWAWVGAQPTNQSPHHDTIPGLKSLQSRGLLSSGERAHIEARAQVCKGNTAGFASHDAFHAHCRCAY